MTYTKKYFRIEDSLLSDFQKISKELGHSSENQTAEAALKLYRDYHFMQNKACFINDQIIQVLQATFRMTENNINYKTNQVLSELAIQAAIQNLILASSLEVDKKDLSNFRLKALDFLKENNRVFRLDEIKNE